jgi:hypothetical protein
MKNWKTTSMGISMIIGSIVGFYFAWKSNTLNEATVTACVTSLLGGIGLVLGKDAGVTGTQK